MSAQICDSNRVQHSWPGLQHHRLCNVHHSSTRDIVHETLSIVRQRIIQSQTCWPHQKEAATHPATNHWRLLMSSKVSDPPLSTACGSKVLVAPVQNLLGFKNPIFTHNIYNRRWAVASSVNLQCFMLFPLAGATDNDRKRSAEGAWVCR